MFSHEPSVGGDMGGIRVYAMAVTQERKSHFIAFA